MNKDELLKLYPEYKGKKNVTIQRYTLFPIAVKSMHSGKQVIFSDAAAQQVIDNIKNMPVTYVVGNGLPEKHRDKNGNRDVVGSTIGGGIFTDENGTRWAYGDVLLYTDAKKDVYEDIINNVDNMATSIEAGIEIDCDNVIHNASYESLSLLNNNNSAWRTELLVADKGDTVDAIEVKYDDILSKLVGKDYDEKLSSKDKVIDELNKLLVEQKTQYEDELKQREEMITESKQYIDSLRDMNQKFSRLVQ
jgi:hypothetical protein